MRNLREENARLNEDGLDAVRDEVKRRAAAEAEWHASATRWCRRLSGVPEVERKRHDALATVLIVGWAIAKGLTPESAHDFPLHESRLTRSPSL